MSNPARRSERLAKQSQRLDYKQFNDSGEKVYRYDINFGQYGNRFSKASNSSSDSDTDTTVKSVCSVVSAGLCDTVSSQDKEKGHYTLVNEIANLVVDYQRPVHKDNKMDKEVKALQRKLGNIQADIEDHLDENQIDESLNMVEDIDKYITKVEKLRTKYRELHQELESLLQDGDDEKKEENAINCKSVLGRIKDYVFTAKENRKRVRQSEARARDQEDYLKEKNEENVLYQKKRATNFLLNEVSRLITELTNEFSKPRVDVSDEELMRRNCELPENMLKLEQLSRKFQQFLETIPDEYPENAKVVRGTNESYGILIKEKGLYENFIKTEIQEREILKENAFKTSFLNIKLSKFKGYNSDLDIFSFQSEFEKLYLKDTPTKMLPDLLKNNYLDNPALALVKRLDTIDEIWARLHKAYGDPRIMLKDKLADVKGIGGLWRLRDSERLKDSLVTLINSMHDLLKLSKKINIEQKLYHGEALDIIQGMMGDVRLTRWLNSISDDELNECEKWNRLISFFEKELKILEEKSLLKYKQDSSNGDNLKDRSSPKERPYAKMRDTYLANTDDMNNAKCKFCDQTGHSLTNGPNKTKMVQYFACKRFVEMTPSQRFKELCSKGYCIQCLYPGAKKTEGKHSNGGCQADYTCKHSSHEKFPSRKHVLVCQEHCHQEENRKTLQEYKSRFILPLKCLEEFSKDIKLSFLSYRASPDDVRLKLTKSKPNPNDESIVDDNGIYILQQIRIGDNSFTLFFDTGCSDLVSRYSAVQKIGENGCQVIPGPTNLGGVGDCKMESPHGIYEVKLPLHNGRNAVLSGGCLDQITSTFPFYPLKGDVEKDIHRAFQLSGGDVKDLPSLPNFVGGDVDFMIGMKYLRYHPEKVFTLPSGLTIYKSPFKNYNGSRGVVGGPHKVFTEIERHVSNSKGCQFSYLTEQLQLYKMGFQVNPDSHLLGAKYPKKFDVHHQNSSSFSIARKQQHFEDVENAASEILFRCIDCRNCLKCKHGEHTEMISVREEIEQDLINKSVTVNIQAGMTTARLPLMGDPSKKLAPNKDKAMAVYNAQLKKLNKCEKDKQDVIESEAKLQSRGHVEYVRNLPVEMQDKLRTSPIQNYIPWRSVWNNNSLTTRCRIVFDASQPTSSSFSLNDILAKGRNNMNKLAEIIIRWRSHLHAYHTDVEQMYPSIILDPDHWCLQRYIYQKDLDPTLIPEEKIIKTAIYGVKSSGNQAERGLRETAKASKEQYPKANEVIQKDVYVDDCLSGEPSAEETHIRADELMVMLKKGGFNLKGFTFSGEPPISKLTEDGECVKVAGLRWFSEIDELQLDVSKINFSKKVRGKKAVLEESFKVPVKLTRRMCVGKVAEVYDLTGRFTPLIADMKLDLHTFIDRKLDWDDAIPDDLRQVWVSHIDMIKEIGRVRFKRAVVPSDAVSLDLNSIDTGDASKSIACIAIYVRFLRKCGDYSCKLIFARSKLLPEGITQPRAELAAAVLNTHTGEVVRCSLSKYHKYSTKLTDSKIVLHWINNKQIPLKQWVRNRVVEICRLSDPQSWMHVSSSDMIADIGTRRGATIEDVKDGSSWESGLSWMIKNVSEFPATKYNGIKYTEDDNMNIENEVIKYKGYSCDSNAMLVTTNPIPNEVSERYQFSRYVLDPNKHRFKRIVRIMAMVRRFINNCRIKVQEKKTQNFENIQRKYQPAALILDDEELKSAANYYYKKATDEVKQFVKNEKYVHISSEKDGIMYYTGRILPDQKFIAISNLTEVMKDLTVSTFCVPIIEKHSPVAYSIVDEVHWYDKVAKHAGVETNLRYTMQYAYILEGRELVRRVKKGCERCRYLHKRSIEVAMGPISSYQLAIAPPFYICQIDLAGPFKAYSPHHKRTSIKVWFAVFCCTTTTTVNIKILEDYSTSAFLLAFTRFSCEVGYPKVLMIDEGSQLIKGCQSMEFNFRDAQSQLNRETNVEFYCCPVGGHNMNGRVERKIRHIKESIEKSMQGERLSIVQWETMCSEIANSINDLPIAIRNVVADLEHVDLVTPNRLMLGRNNARSPVGPLLVTGKPDKIIAANENIFNAWFELWLISYVPKLMDRPKWFDSDRNVKVGDIVLFLKKEGDINNSYQYGKITSAPKGKDGRIRSVTVSYRNHNEDAYRETKRAVRELVIIHAVDELNIVSELGKIATAADVMYKLRQ